MTTQQGIFSFSVSGIIGTGKSTALRRLDETHALARLLPHVELTFVQEPVELWKREGWLQDFYANPTQNGLPFQLIVFDTHCEVVEAAIAARKNPTIPLVIITERCVYGQHLFWSMQQQSQDRLAHEAYMRTWRRRHFYVPEPAGIMLFTPTSVVEAQRRAARRARNPLKASTACDEQLHETEFTPEQLENVDGLTLAYQQRLHDRHLTYFNEGLAFPPGAKQGIPCIHVSTDKPYHTDDDALHSLARTMADFIGRVLPQQN